MPSRLSSLYSYVLLLGFMSRPHHGGPPFGSAQPQRPTTDAEVLVATSPPSTTDTNDVTPASGVQLVSATVAAQFNYPVGLLKINNLDTVVVDYDTAWSDASLSVTCSGNGVGGTKTFDLPLSSADGQYSLQPIEDEITVTEWPISCYIMLRDGASTTNFAMGPTIDITSTAGVASIYAASATKVADSKNGPAASTVKDGSTSATPTATNSAADATATASTTATPTAVAGSTSSDSAGSSSGTSTGAKSGIAIGVLLVIALIVFGIWFFLRQRRRMQTMQTQLQETKQQHETERRYVDGILKVAGKPDTRNGGRLVMAETPNRGSGEWKQFFNAKVAEKGSAPPSRLGVVTPVNEQTLTAIPDSPGQRSMPGDEAVSTTDFVRK